MKKAILFLDPRGTALEVVRAAHARGYEVLAMLSDRAMLTSAAKPYDSAIPLVSEIRDVASWDDLAHVESVFSELARTWTIAGVYYNNEACALPGMVLRKKCGLPHTDPDVLRSILPKNLLRQKLRSAGLSRLRTFSQEEANTWERWPLEFPVYFKPIQGSFSAYVKKCAGWEDFQAARSELENGSPSDPRMLREYVLAGGGYFLEEAFPGELMSVEAFNYHGEFMPIGLTSRILLSSNPTVEMGSCFPYDRPDRERIIEFVRAAHQALGFTDGPTHVELIVSAQGEMEIIDFNPRFIGADVLQSINHAYGIRAEELLTDIATGIRPSFQPTQKLYSCIQYVLCPPIRVFQGIRLPETPEVRFATSFIKPGTELRSTDRQLDYAGCYLTVLPGFEEAIRRSMELRAQVRINGEHHGVF